MQRLTAGAVGACGGAAAVLLGVRLSRPPTEERAMQAAEPPVFPNLACYRGTVEACAEAGEWEAALAVWQGMQSGVLRREI